MVLKFLLIFTLIYAVPFLSMGSLHGCHIKLAILNLWKKYKDAWCVLVSLHPGGSLSINSVRLEKLNLMSLCNRYTYLAISFVSKCLYRKYDVDPFEYISLNSHHKNTLNFVILMPELRALNALFLIDFLRILISFLKIFVINFFLVSQGF